jgi:5-methylcytosine-specific restriction endonuclease McrA
MSLKILRKHGQNNSFMPVKRLNCSMSENGFGEPSSGNTQTDKESSVCPTCGKSLKSVKGKRQHHKRAHGESIAKTDVDCSRCGDSHTRWRSQLDGGPYYCSEGCRIAELNENQDPEYNREIVSCSYCGKNIERRVSRIERSEHLYCDRECANNGHSERVSGKGNPRWVGGYDSYYGENWNKQRDKTRERDNHTCQRCGITEKELGRQLSVHHKIPFRKFDSHKEANKLDNLISLCGSCHGIVEAWPVQPI